MLRVTGLGKEYEDKVALFDVDLTFPDKGLVIIKGESGSGKTTLLNLLTAHDYPTMGCIEFDGVEINSKNRESYRKEHCSNIYQDYMLIEDMSVGDNIGLALQAYGESNSIDLIKELLRKVGLSEEFLKKQASKLSGGEKQRVSIARAIAKRDSMVFADEPTGNLDSQNGEKIMDLLKDISKDRLVVIVSHNESFNVKYADYTVELVDGVVENCDLPEECRIEHAVSSFTRKSKLKAKTIIKLTFWGFKKNKAKAVVSIVSFVIFCILTVVFAAVSFSDINLAYSHSLNKCQNKNFIAGILYKRNATIEGVNRFKENLSIGCSEIYMSDYQFYLGKTDEDEEAKYCKKYKYFIPSVGGELLYNQDIGLDVEVLYGDFPKEFNEVMLPYCYAKYIAQVFIDYKTDDVKNLIGKTIKYGKNQDDTFDFKICGIFEEGPYYTDFESLSHDDIGQYYKDTNKLATCAIFSPEVKEILMNDMLGSNICDVSNNFYVKDRNVNFYGYDIYRDYAKEYTPLEYGEVYISQNVADIANLKVGDALAYTHYSAFNSEEYKDFDGMTVKGILDLPYDEFFIIFSSQFCYDNFLKGVQLERLMGFYFNMNGVKNTYELIKEIRIKGNDEQIWWSSDKHDNVDCAYTENINVTIKFYENIYGYIYFVFIPLTVISLIGLVSMGFVSASYLIESKGNAYNILRSVGFGKRNIASILAMQIFLLIIVGCVLGIGIGALCCQLFGKMYVKSKLGVAANLTNEVVLPMGYIAPTIVLAVSVLLVAIIVVIKIKSLFGKSIVANKQSE